MTDAQPVPDGPLQRRSRGRRLTAAEVEELHGVPASTVRSWAIGRRGRPPRIFAVGIVPAGANGGRGSPIYDERHLQPLIDAWKTRRPDPEETP